MRPQDTAYIIERLAVRFMAMVADHERQLAEHRAAFGARTEADAKIIAGLRAERDGLLTQVQDMRAEIERLKKPARQHPVAVGEWVLRTGGGGAYPIGTVAQVNQYSPSGDYLVRLAGQTRIVTWFKENCTPCDPPEATHDTPEGRASAESCQVTTPYAAAFTLGNNHGEYVPFDVSGGGFTITLPANPYDGMTFHCAMPSAAPAAPDEIKVGDVVRATFWKAGQAAVVKEILADGRLMLDCSDQPWRVDEVVKLMRKVTP